LLIIDVISDFRFEDGGRLLGPFGRAARNIAALKRRAGVAGIPAIYVNDNFGRWRSDVRSLVAHCTHPSRPGAALVRLLAPTREDYFVLKPRHSAFYASALEALLSFMGIRRLIITGVSSHQCVLFTANDAYVRQYEMKIPRDCIAAPEARQTRFALRYFEMVLGADTRPSGKARYWRAPRQAKQRRSFAALQGRTSQT
jgi:nicotinamidase-related amidase